MSLQSHEEISGLDGPDVPALNEVDHSPLAVSVLTGFLGAGKTTVLRALLESERFGDSAVLVNEFGEVGIDHLLVDAISPDIVLLDSGCVCCQIRGELKDALNDLLDRRGDGDVPRFKRIIIETTGLAEPGPVVSTLVMDPVLSRRVTIGAVVTVVDALTTSTTVERRREWLEQVAAADVLLLSKTDLVTADSVARLSTELESANPSALVHDWRTEPDCLQRLLSSRTAVKTAAVMQSMQPQLRFERSSNSGSLPHGRHLRSFILNLEQTIDWTAFGIWFSALLHSHGDRILRVKGLVEVGEPGPILFNSVQHTVFPPEHFQEWPEGASSQLVFIVDDIAPGLIEESFKRYVVDAMCL